MVSARLDYVELPSVTAHELTRAFYVKAFGWTFVNHGPEYAAAETDAAELALNGSPDEALAAPLPIVRVDDLDTALTRVLEAGAVLARPVFAYPGGRRFHFIDPSGNELAVYEPTAE